MLSIGGFARLAQVSPRTLRHYDELGLLEPARVDAETGYRYYEYRQLADLHRVLALRDLGLELSEIRSLLETDRTMSVEQLRGMLRLRQAEISASIAEQQDRLRRVAAHLDAMEQGEVMHDTDVIVKTPGPLRMAAASGVAPTYGYANVHPVFEAHLPAVTNRLREAGVEPGMHLAYFEWPDDDGKIVIHMGFEIGDQSLEDTDEVRVVELPSLEVAAAVHRGSLTEFTDTFQETVRWIETSGYHIAGYSRELYLAGGEGDPSQRVTELQIPVSRTAS